MRFLHGPAHAGPWYVVSMKYLIEFLHFVGGFTLIITLSLIAVSLASGDLVLF